MNQAEDARAQLAASVVYEVPMPSADCDSPAALLAAFAARDACEERLAVERVALRLSLTAIELQAHDQRAAETLRRSRSYRLGNALLLALGRPGRDTLRLPRRLWDLLLGRPPR